MAQRRIFLVISLFALLAFAPPPAHAEGVLIITVDPEVTCDGVNFAISISGGSGSYLLYMEFGDSETLTAADFTASSYPISHVYLGGEYPWNVSVADNADPTLAGTAAGIIFVGPKVNLTTNLMPPVFDIIEGAVSVDFVAEVNGGLPPLSYAWTFANASSSTSTSDSNTGSATYDMEGKYTASVTVMDTCGFQGSDSLTILIDDPESSCHPMAQRIADAVNTLLPTRADQLYSCEDIYSIFQGDPNGSNVGFGRLWQAYRLTERIDELTWEEIRDWHLDGAGWGLLIQLDRFADTLDENITDILAYLEDDAYTLGDLRTALRIAAQSEVDFEDALSRLAEGISSGELKQFYRTATTLGIDPATLDAYLESGASLQEIQHAAKLAEQTGGEITAVLQAHAGGQSWGELKKAYADEKTTDKNTRTAQQIADKYGVPVEDVMGLFEGDCINDWSCVRAIIREQARNVNEQGPSDKKKPK
jgi:PKD repeat protein